MREKESCVDPVAEDGARPQPETGVAASLHTPGPWRAQRGEWPHSFSWVVTSEAYPNPGSPLAILQDFDEAAEPDARLIAAAPELLEALRAAKAAMFNLLLVAEVPDRFAASFNEVQNKAAAAIAKASPTLKTEE